MSGIKKRLRSCADVSNQIFLHRNERRTVIMNYSDGSVVADGSYSIETYRNYNELIQWQLKK